MKLTPANVNSFLLFKLPAAFLSGVRLKSINNDESVVSVRYRWINQNPFRSMYFAVQMMAAELSTGILVMAAIRESKKNVSMLVAANHAVYHKKVAGRVVFTCVDGEKVRKTLATIEPGEGITLNLKSVGINEAGQTVSEMIFEWTLKLR